VTIKIITLDRAKSEIKRLQAYVDLVEVYQPATLEEEIIKEYAITSSIPAVIKKLSVSHEKVVDVISSRGKDDLHKIARSVYMQKTRRQRERSTLPYSLR
jgi:predicted CoA-binding protein